MILRAIPESKRGIKTSSRRNIRPLVETKMPLSYQVSGVTWGSQTFYQFNNDRSIANWKLSRSSDHMDHAITWFHVIERLNDWMEFRHMKGHVSDRCDCCAGFQRSHGRIVTRYVFSSLIPFLYPNFWSLVPKAWKYWSLISHKNGIAWSLKKR